MKLRTSFILVLVLLAQYVFAQKSGRGMKLINGTHLYFEAMGKGEPILVIHGGPGLPHDYFLPYLEELAKTNLLIFYDQRSTGKSVIPDDTIGTAHKKMIDDIEAIRKAFGISKLNILAHSWGTRLAVNYALKYPASMRSLVLSNSIAMNHDYDSLQKAIADNKIYTPGFKEKKEEIQKRTISIMEIRMRFAFLASMYNPENVDKVKLAFPEDFGDKQRALFRGLTSDLAAYDIDYFPKLQQIKCPVLVIHGDADAIPLAANERLASVFAKGRLVHMEKSGHFPFIEQPVEYTQVISKFVATLK